MNKTIKKYLTIGYNKLMEDKPIKKKKYLNKKFGLGN